jgi:hypothetical protein
MEEQVARNGAVAVSRIPPAVASPTSGGMEYLKRQLGRLKALTKRVMV